MTIQYNFKKPAFSVSEGAGFSVIETSIRDNMAELYVLQSFLSHSAKVLKNWKAKDINHTLQMFVLW